MGFPVQPSGCVLHIRFRACNPMSSLLMSNMLIRYGSVHCAAPPPSEDAAQCEGAVPQVTVACFESKMWCPSFRTHPPRVPLEPTCLFLFGWCVSYLLPHVLLLAPLRPRPHSLVLVGPTPRRHNLSLLCPPFLQFVPTGLMEWDSSLGPFPV